MTDRLLDLTAAAILLTVVWVAVTRLAFVIGPHSCWTTC